MVARQFDEMEDEYLRERKADLEQVVERLLGVLARGEDGASALPARQRGPADADADPLVLVANDISPADMLQWKGGLFLGFVTEVGGKTSHTAIVARSLDIPAVVGAREASRLIRQDDWVVIDAACVFLFYVQDLQLLALLNVLFVGIATAGFMAWWRRFKQQLAPAVAA